MKKKRIKIIIIILFIVILCGVFTSSKKPTHIKQEDLRIDEHINDVSEFEKDVDDAFQLLKLKGNSTKNIWPEYDLSQNAIIVCQRDDETNQVIHAWKLTTKDKTLLANKDFLDVEVPAAGSYNGTEIEGINSIIIAINKKTVPSLKDITILNYIYEIGVHEMVHFHYEPMFKLLKLSLEQKIHGGRGTEFPNVAQPRVYRKMIYDNLVKAFENPQDEKMYLAQAKYWYDKWEKEFPKEYYQIKTTDYMEGKARYIQYMMCIPENLSDKDKTSWIIDHFDKSLTPSISMDSESYKLGFVAGVLLDRQGFEWKKQMTQKTQTPVELLLKNVVSKQDESEDFQKKLQISKQQVEKKNQEIEKKISHIKEAENNIQIPFLKIDDKFIDGSYETSGFIKYLNKNVTVEFKGTFENQNGTININHCSVYEQEGLFQGAYILPLTMEYSLSNGRLVIHSEDAFCDIQVKQTKDKDGRILYIME